MLCIFPAFSLPSAFKLETTEKDDVISPFQMFFGLFEISGHVSPSENSKKLDKAIQVYLLILLNSVLTR